MICTKNTALNNSLLYKVMLASQYLFADTIKSFRVKHVWNLFDNVVNKSQLMNFTSLFSYRLYFYSSKKKRHPNPVWQNWSEKIINQIWRCLKYKKSGHMHWSTYLHVLSTCTLQVQQMSLGTQPFRISNPTPSQPPTHNYRYSSITLNDKAGLVVLLCNE